MDRKPKPSTYIKPMPVKQLRTLIKSFEGQGGRVIMDEKSEEYLDLKGAEASTLNENTILLRRKPGRAAVYEELFHAEQFKKGENDGTMVSRYKCEIEAKKYLIEHAEELKLTGIEIEQTKQSLKTYIRLLKEMEAVT